MSHYVVTISRQFAAMGRTIGLKMASNLGVELLDRDIVKEAAKRCKNAGFILLSTVGAMAAINKVFTNAVGTVLK